MSNKKSLILKCEDNCSAISFDKWDDEDTYFITTYKSYSTKSFTERMKDIWRIIKGEDVVGTEIILNHQEFSKISELK